MGGEPCTDPCRDDANAWAQPRRGDEGTDVGRDVAPRAAERAEDVTGLLWGGSLADGGQKSSLIPGTKDIGMSGVAAAETMAGGAVGSDVVSGRGVTEVPARGEPLTEPGSAVPKSGLNDDASPVLDLGVRL